MKEKEQDDCLSKVKKTDTCVLEVICSCEASVHSAEHRVAETIHHNFITVEGNYVAICCVHP